MGCWNHTCALTNLPVHYGDEVYVFLLEEYPFGGNPSHCYPNGVWDILPLHFEGTYDDYGGVENCHGPMLNTIIEAVKESLVEMEEGENPFHDIAVTKEGFDVKKLFEADHEGRLYVKGMFSQCAEEKQKLRLKHIVILKSALDELLATYKVEKWDENYRPVGVPFDELLNDAKAYVNIIVNLNDDQLHAVQMLGHVRTRGQAGDWFAGLVRGGGESRFGVTMRASSLFQDAFWMLRDDRVKAAEYLNTLAYQVAVFGWLEWFMIDCRRSWTVPSGSGSQNSRTEAQRTIANITLKLAHEIDHRWDEDEDEDDE